MSLLNIIRSTFLPHEATLLANAERARVTYPRERGTVARYGVDAAQQAGGMSGWTGSASEYQNQEYVQSLPQVLKRAQDLDVNNPDIRGHHRNRTARCIGRGIRFKAAPRADEIGQTLEVTQEIARRLNRERDLHSRMGHFDASGRRRTEEKLQEITFLTGLVQGRCLVHRVWAFDGGRRIPLAMELIPGSRISTPFERMSDPLISYGVQYADEYRSRVTGWWVQRVPRTVGNNFIPEYKWDFVPAEDGAIFELTEQAGLDVALPQCVAAMKSVYNRGQMMESVIEAARAHAAYYAVHKTAAGANPFDSAEDEADGVTNDATPVGFVNVDGVKMYFIGNDEDVQFNNAKLPDPDFTGFMGVTDERIARGLNTSRSAFTRHVDASYSAGRQEEQMDDPVVDQLRESFLCAWQKVHEWFIDACWLAGVVELPGYSEATRCYWTEARTEMPGKVHINPVDTAAARQIGFALRTLTPQQACEEDGKDLHDNVEQWAAAIQMVRAAEEKYKLLPGSLDYLLDQPVLQAVSQPVRDVDGDGMIGKGKPNVSTRGQQTFAARARAAQMARTA